VVLDRVGGAGEEVPHLVHVAPVNVPVFRILPDLIPEEKRERRSEMAEGRL
jgi:hypothetical protein